MILRLIRMSWCLTRTEPLQRCLILLSTLCCFSQVEAAEANSWRISALTAQAERDWFQEQLAAEAARRAVLLQQLGEAEGGRAEANSKVGHSRTPEILMLLK